MNYKVVSRARDLEAAREADKKQYYRDIERTHRRQWEYSQRHKGRPQKGSPEGQRRYSTRIKIALRALRSVLGESWSASDTPLWFWQHYGRGISKYRHDRNNRVAWRTVKLMLREGNEDLRNLFTERSKP